MTTTVDITLPNANIIGDEHHIEPAAFGGLCGGYVGREIGAHVGWYVAVPPRHDMLSYGSQNGAQSHSLIVHATILSN